MRPASIPLNGEPVAGLEFMVVGQMLFDEPLPPGTGAKLAAAYYLNVI